MGHALGWVGHASKNNVMYKQESDVTILTKVDKRHLKQVY
jgi:predicted Zn-dependent protease